MQTTRKNPFGRKFLNGKNIALSLALSIFVGLFIVPSGSARAEDVASSSVGSAVGYDIPVTGTKDDQAVVDGGESASLLNQEDALNPSDDEIAKEQLAEKINSLAGKLYGGITSVTLSDCGKRAAGFVGAFSDEYLVYKKEQEKKAAASAAKSSGSKSNREHSDVLVYKYNPDFVKDVTDEEFEVLCRITEAEAGDQDVYGRILVVNVILNRVNYKKEFANDIKGVVFEKGQFSPISNGSYYSVEVDDVTREAVTRALEGEDYSNGALYFFMRSATSKSAASWFDSLEFVLKYGCHEFFKG